MTRPDPSPRAFSLVELMVVVSIIALLLGLLFPSLAASRRQAKVVACRVHLRSLGQLVQMYAMENDGRIPRGPSLAGVNPLLSTHIATNLLWGHAGERAEYVGLGLTQNTRRKSENDIFFCPADAERNVPEESRRIGSAGVEAYGSYLYRQMDMTPAQVERQGRIDDLGTNEVIGGVDAGFHHLGCRHDVTVRALAMDLNRDGAGDFYSRNHGARMVNVLYLDGSVAGFDNETQRCSSGMRPWGTISQASVDQLPDDVSDYLCELDRLFVAADWGMHRDPQTAPVPLCGSTGDASFGPVPI